MSMSNCMDIVNSMVQKDQDAVLARLEAYRAAGLTPERAQTLAATDVLDQIQSDRADFVRLIEEQHPDYARRQVNFEVAPDPNDESMLKAWRGLAQEERLAISDRVARDIVPKVLKLRKVSGQILEQFGSYLDDTNPSFALKTSSDLVSEMSSDLGYVLAQDSMMNLSDEPFAGAEEHGAVIVDLGDVDFGTVERVYSELHTAIPEIGGQSFTEGWMKIINMQQYSGITDEDLIQKVDALVGKKYTVWQTKIYASFIEKGNYRDYQTVDGSGTDEAAQNLREGLDRLRGEATQAIRDAIEAADARVQRSGKEAKLSARDEDASKVLDKKGNFKAWPKSSDWTRQEYNDVVGLLPQDYRDDPYRRKPLPTGYRDALPPEAIQRLSDIQASAQGGPGAYDLDSLGNIVMDGRRATLGDYRKAADLAEDFDLGVMAVHVKQSHMASLVEEGFRGEPGLAMVLMRATGEKTAPMERPSDNTYTRDAYSFGTMMSREPRGFPHALMFSKRDLFGGFANKGTTITQEKVINSRGDVRQIERGNINSDGQKITGTRQGLENFWNWFDNSWATDDAGAPLVLYHSSGNDIDTLKTGRESVNNYGLMGNVKVTRAGIFATPNREFSQEYLPAQTDGYGQNVMPVYMSLQEPFDSRALSPTLVSRLQNAGLYDTFKNARNDWALYDNNDDGSNPFVDGLKELGFDGAIFNEEDEDGNEQTTYMAFESTQVKSATGNLGTFNPEDGRLSYSVRDLGFYSELAKQINQASMKQAPAAEWKSFIKALGQKGVKADEVEWSGINDWLDLQTGKVAKADVLAYLDANGVQVEEIVLGAPDYSDVEVWWEDEGGANEETPFNELSPRERADAAARYADETGQYLEGERQTPKYGQYTLPGGTNYREVLLTLPGGKEIGSYAEWLAQRLNITPDDAEDSAEYEDDALHKQFMQEESSKKSSYHSSHWDQPNIIAHLRVNDRTDADGEPVLFVEELQSDFGQDFKKAKDAINKAVDSDFLGIVERMKAAGVLEVECD